MAIVAMLAACAGLASGMPRAPAWLFAAAALMHGAWRARRMLAMPAFELAWDRRGGAPTTDGAAMHGPVLQWRGPCAFLRWRDDDGRRHRCAWWPDTLPPAARRELRLAAWQGDDAPARASMAP